MKITSIETKILITADLIIRLTISLKNTAKPDILVPKLEDIFSSI